MRILYGIQGTGHGHISRAKELLPELSKYASVEVIFSACSNLPDLRTPVKYSKYGISLAYDRNGGVDILDTLLDFHPIRFIRDVQSISITDYDLVISDYEPVSAWSARLKSVPSVALSHQAAFLSQNTPRPRKRSWVAEMILQHFAPAEYSMGFHFKRYDDFIEPPIIRSDIRALEVTADNHITVYLPAYHHKILQKIFAPFTHVEWHIFSPTCTEKIKERNFRIYPIGDRPFLDSLASCEGVICGAGFETCAEAMYLGKKLLAIPINNQYEQECNAAALEGLGVLVMKSLKDNSNKLWHWLETSDRIYIDEVADPKKIIKQIFTIGFGTKEKSQVLEPVFK